MKKPLLFLTQTGPKGPSSRYRIWQYAPEWKKLGLDFEIRPAVSDERYEYFYSRRTLLQRVELRSVILRKRRTDLEEVDRFSAVILQKEFLPGWRPELELQFARKKPLVLDLDDAIWLPRAGGHWIMKLLHQPNAIPSLLESMQLVLAGNEYLADYAAKFAQRVEIIPTTLNLDRYPWPAPEKTDEQKQAPVLVWIGSSTTFQYLEEIFPVLERLSREEPFVLKVIGANVPGRRGFKVIEVPWNEETEWKELVSADIALAPMPDNPWTQGKCGLKVLQYLACGIPTVASDLITHRRIMNDGKNGYLASTHDQWIACIKRLLKEPGLCEQLSKQGRRTVEENYSMERYAKKLFDLFSTI